MAKEKAGKSLVKRQDKEWFKKNQKIPLRLTAALCWADIAFLLRAQGSGLRPALVSSL